MFIVKALCLLALSKAQKESNDENQWIYKVFNEPKPSNTNEWTWFYASQQ